MCRAPLWPEIATNPYDEASVTAYTRFFGPRLGRRRDDSSTAHRPLIDSNVATPRHLPRLPRVALLRQVPPTLAWVLSAIALVIAWGLIDPGDMRQRMDWSLGDRWLAQRTPPELDPDIVLVLEDDVAAAELGQTNARHRRARALRQLRRLGARTVVFDFLLLDAGSDVSFYQDEALYDGLPTRQLVQDTLRRIYSHDEFYDTEADRESLRQARRATRWERLYTEDALQRRAFEVLAGSGDDTTRIVLASHFRHAPVLDQQQVQSLIDELTQNPWHTDTTTLARSSNVSRTTLANHFEFVVAEAAHRIVHRDRATALEVVAANAQLMADPLRRALDKTKPVLLEALDRSTFETNVPQDQVVPTLDQLELPRWQFTEHTILAFSDGDLQRDFVLRRLLTSQAFTITGNSRDDTLRARRMVHQAVAAFRLHTTSQDSLNSPPPQTTGQAARIDAPVPDQELIINWPLHGRSSWGEQLDRSRKNADDLDAHSQVVRVSDLLQLAQSDREIHATRYEIRLRAIRLIAALGIDSPIPDQVRKLETALESALSGQSSTEQLAAKHSAIELSIRALLADEDLGKPPDLAAAVPAAWTTRLTRLLDTELPAGIQARQDLQDRLGKQLADKLCLVGQVKTGLVDLHNTPIGRLPGVLINAAAVNTLLSDNALAAQSLLSTLLVTIAVMLAAALLFAKLDVVPATASLIPLLLVIGWVHHGLLAWTNTITQPVLPLLGVVACFSAVTIRKWWHDNLARRKVRRAFEFYLHPAVVQQVAEHPDALQLGGAATDISILFSDIRGFTTIAERLPDDQLTSLLNEYLTAMTEVVFENNGTVDKYIGDAIMAFFGAPIESDTHPLEACRTAIRMSQRLVGLRQQWRDRGLPLIKIGIGINSDTVRIGNFGSNLRFDYTIIGDGVNLASRLEGANKQYGTEMLISASTWERVRDELVARELDLIQVKGRQQPTRIFELMGERSASDELLERVAKFDEAVTMYRDQQFAEALAVFTSLDESDATDQPARIYVQRCRSLIETPPAPDWDGVYVMTSK